MLDVQQQILNQSYYDGEQANVWLGFLNGSEADTLEARDQFNKILCGSNLIKECTNRFIDALVSDAPAITTKPTPGELVGASAIDEQLSQLVISLNQMASASSDTAIHPIKDWILQGLVQGNSWLRLYSPTMYRNNPNPLMRLSCEVVPAGKITTERDDEGSLISLVYHIARDKYERQSLDPITGILHFSIYNSESAYRQNIPTSEFDLDLQHHWSLVPLRVVSPITKSVRNLQNNIALNMTLANKNVVTAGLIERFIFNGEEPGYTTVGTEGQEVFVPEPMLLGSDVVNFVQGKVTKDDAGKLTLATPQMHIKEPSSSATFHEQLKVLVDAFYMEFSQGHILTGGNSQMSGDSRVMLHADFIRKVNSFKGAIEPGLSSFYRAALLMYSIVNGEPGSYDNVDVIAKLNINTVLLSEEHKAITSDFTSGIVSHESTLLKLGWESPNDEIALLDAEKQKSMDAQPITLDQLTPASLIAPTPENVLTPLE